MNLEKQINEEKKKMTEITSKDSITLFETMMQVYRFLFQEAVTLEDVEKLKLLLGKFYHAISEAPSYYPFRASDEGHTSIEAREVQDFISLNYLRKCLRQMMHRDFLNLSAEKREVMCFSYRPEKDDVNDYGWSTIPETMLVETCQGLVKTTLEEEVQRHKLGYFRMWHIVNKTVQEEQSFVALYRFFNDNFLNSPLAGKSMEQLYHIIHNELLGEEQKGDWFATFYGDRANAENRNIYYCYWTKSCVYIVTLPEIHDESESLLLISPDLPKPMHFCYPSEIQCYSLEYE